MIRRLLWFEPFWLLGLAPLILLPGRLLPGAWQVAVVLALFLFWPLRWIETRRLLPAAPPNLALIALLLWLPVNLWAAIDKTIAWEAAGYLLLGVTFYVAAVGWAPLQRQPTRLAWLLIALAAGLAVLGPLIAGQDRSWPLIGPLQRQVAPLAARLGESINPNILAGALVVVLPIVLTMAWAPSVGRRNWTRTVLLSVLALLILMVIGLSNSRGAQLAAGASLLVWLYLRWPVIVWITPLLLIAAAAVIDNIDFIALMDTAGSGSAIGGLDERMEIWGRALYALQDFAFTGVGIGHFNQVIPLLYPYFLIAPSVDIPHAHNLILQIGIDLGIPGLIAWLAVVLAIFALLASVMWRPANPLARTLAAGAIAGLVAMLVHGIVDAALWGVKLAFIPWLLYALACLSTYDQQR